MKRTATSRTIRTAALTAGAPILTLGMPSAPAQAADGTPGIDQRVLPHDNPFPAGSQEKAALIAHERAYAIPRVDAHEALHANNTPLVDLRMKDIGAEPRDRAVRNDAVTAGQVTGYRIGDTVAITPPEGVAAPAAMPGGTTQLLPGRATGFGRAYAGTVSGRVAAASGQAGVTLTLPGVPASAAGGAAAPSPDVPVPAGVETPVTQGETQRS
ncbi:hypothetical protein [Streptomyces sp. NPDC059828]|uniref:hypothetical protein n=1 Tax=Streptomyces sp. NPDC059828 TaxID=3346965 RepID=UPI0036548111